MPLDFIKMPDDAAFLHDSTSVCCTVNQRYIDITRSRRLKRASWKQDGCIVKDLT